MKSIKEQVKKRGNLFPLPQLEKDIKKFTKAIKEKRFTAEDLIRIVKRTERKTKEQILKENDKQFDKLKEINKKLKTNLREFMVSEGLKKRLK